MFKIDNKSFGGYSHNDKKISKYLVSKNSEIVKQNEIDNIRLFKLNNSSIIYGYNYLLLNYEENHQFGIIIINLDKFQIIKKITNKIALYYINNSNKFKIITINENGYIQKWNFSESQNKLYEKDKIKVYNNNSVNQNIIGFVEMSHNIFLFQYENRITRYYKNDICF